MPDYQQGKIYRLVSNKTEDVYYGATTRALTHRLNHHKNNPICSSKKLFENDAIVTIVLVEASPCNNKNELKARELFYITNNPCININKPFISDKQQIGGDRVEWSKEYREANKQAIAGYQKAYNEVNKEKIAEHKKEYREANKQAISEQKKEYREANKQAIKEQANQKITCACGSTIRTDSSAKHNKSTKHQEFLKQ